MKQRELDITSNDNTLFVTEQCNNRCLMCCQPPRKVDDIDILYKENIRRIKSAPKNLPCFGITGGEPTLLNEKLIDLVGFIRSELPETEIHILTNGRKFVDAKYARRLVDAGGHKLVFGIPLHSDYEKDHDIIAGARNAYAETMIGLYNLAMQGAIIELRIVMNKLNFTRFPEIALFIHKNLPFVSWIAFMGMEKTGYAETKTEQIWIEPSEYMIQLCNAVEELDSWGYDVCIYNIPMCLIPGNYRKFAVKSISDWKNYYLPICDSCSKKEDCCGFFSTSTEPYKLVKTIS